MDVKTKICDKKGRKGEASKAGRGKEGFIIKGTTHCGNFPPTFPGLPAGAIPQLLNVFFFVCVADCIKEPCG